MRNYQMTELLYQDHLEDILRFTHGRRLLSVADVGRYTGLRDVRTIRRRFPCFQGKYLSAATLARALSGDLETEEEARDVAM